MTTEPPAQIGTLAAHDGFPLRTVVWPAPPGGGRGTVVLLQGRAEFIEKYGETVGELRARGFAVYALDWRGQGHSGRVLKDPHKGHVVSYEDYLKDLDLFLSGWWCPKPRGPSCCWPIPWAATSCSVTERSTKPAPGPILPKGSPSPPPWWTF